MSRASGLRCLACHTAKGKCLCGDTSPPVLTEVLISLEQMLNITYYHHSGFSVEMQDVLLVFDYWRGEHQELPEGKRITPAYLSSLK